MSLTFGVIPNNQPYSRVELTLRVAGQHELDFNLFMYFFKREKEHEVLSVGKWTLSKQEREKNIINIQCRKKSKDKLNRH